MRTRKGQHLGGSDRGAHRGVYGGALREPDAVREQHSACIPHRRYRSM